MVSLVCGKSQKSMFALQSPAQSDVSVGQNSPNSEDYFLQNSMAFLKVM